MAHRCAWGQAQGEWEDQQLKPGEFENRTPPPDRLVQAPIPQVVFVLGWGDESPEGAWAFCQVSSCLIPSPGQASGLDKQ